MLFSARPVIGLGFALGIFVSAQAQTGTAFVQHAPTLNGSVQGSVQQMSAESTNFNSGASVTGNLFIVGTPAVQLNGSPTYGGTLEGSGLATPTSHRVTINSGASLSHVVRRTNAVSLPSVSAPSQPTGTRSITLNNSAQSAGDFSTLRNLTLNSGVGSITVPSGTYGNFAANSGSGFILGVAGATTPSIYNFQALTLNGGSSFQVVGPVEITLNAGLTLNANMGSSAHPEWMKLRFATGGLTLNGNVAVYAHVEAPLGTVTINGGTQFSGTLASSGLTINSNGVLLLTTPPTTNVKPTVSLTSPSSGSAYQAPAALTLVATAADSDGSIARVEFYSGATKLGEALSAPYQVALSNLSAGSYAFTARAIDNLGASTDSTAVNVIVASPNQPPAVSLTAPLDGASFFAPASLTLKATASDPDGNIAKVEFYQGTTKVGETSSTPFQVTTASLSAGSYQFSAKAYDNLNATATSTVATVIVAAPNQPPTVAISTPANGSSYNGPATFTISANASDADGSIAKVEFFQNGVNIGQQVVAPYNFAINALGTGSYNFVVRATDNAGAAIDSAPTTVVVLGANQPPVVTLTTPIAGASFTAPATISLTATASDSDGTITLVEFFQDTTKLGQATTAPYAYSWAGVTEGSYNITAKATDNRGGVTTSVPVLIVVSANNNLPFVASFETDQGYAVGSLNNQKGWTATGSSVVTVADAFSGTQSVLLPSGNPPLSVTRVFAPHAGHSVLFIDLFTLPQASATEDTSAQYIFQNAAKVAFTRSGTNGQFSVFAGNGSGGGSWQSTPVSIPIDANGYATGWLRLTVRIDYAAKKWDLYVGGSIVAASISFSDSSQSTLGSFTLRGQTVAPTLLDDFLAAFDNPLFVDADRDGMDDAWEIAHGLNPSVDDRDADPDGDGISNIQEYLRGTDPNGGQTQDLDGNGLADSWESGYFGHTGVNRVDDPDGDGLSNLEEYQQGTSPVDFYNGHTPIFTIVSGGNGELGPDGVFTVLVTRTDGSPYKNAPVHFEITDSGYRFASTPDSTTYYSDKVFRTESDGKCSVYVRGGVL